MAQDFIIYAKVQADTQNIQKQLDAFSKNQTISIKADTKDFEMSISVANKIMSEFVDIAADMVGQVYELDSAMIEFQKVSDLSGEALDRYVDKLGDLGENVARTTSEMVQAATEFRKSGFNDEDSAQLAEVAAMLQNVADEELSAGDAANFLVSQMRAFNLDADGATHILDALNEVSNNFAVSSSDLTKSLPLVSAALSVGNNEYEEMIGLMTGIVEITRNSNRAARGLVSVQSRLNQIVDESSSTGQALSTWYQQHNVEIYDQAGQLRSLYDILTDVSKIWDTLSTNEKDYYLNQQAGEFYAPLA